MHQSSATVAVLICGVLCCGVLFLGGCDATPGPVDPEGQAPSLSNLSFSPSNVILGQIPPEQIEGDLVRVPVSFRVEVADPDGDVDRVAYAIQSPIASRSTLASGTLDGAGNGVYRGNVDVRLPKGEVGTYTLLLYAVDQEGRLSNQVRGSMRFFAEGSPPVIEQVEAFPEVVRPPTTFRLVATVSDPDGLGNISRVVGTTPNGSTFDMLDDGVNFGDEVAGDGRFTAQFDVPAATPGVQTFTFQAFDRTGLASNVVEKQITIE